MKKPSRRARRMERHHKMRKGSGLNLVSLMDIFTILVFFLLVNSSSTQQLPSQKDLTLPKSVAQKPAKDTVILVITPKSLLLQGREVMSIDAANSVDQDVLDPLLKELEFQSKNRQLANTPADEDGRPITIMGDENIPYELLRKILATCQQANYTQIAFAAQQVAKPKS